MTTEAKPRQGLNRRYLLLLLLTTITSVWSQDLAQSQGSSSGTSSTFQVFDATLYHSKPDLSSAGLRPIAAAYGGQFGSNWSKDPRQLPPKDAVQQVARDAGRKGELVFLDIEHWPQRGTATEVSDSVSRYRQVVQWFREAAPGLPLGYYGAPPVQDYWRAIALPTSREFIAWTTDNDQLRSLAMDVDILYPSLYTFYEDRAGWKKFALAQIAEARRYGGGKPVYVFLWPQYHDSNATLGWRFLPTDFWLFQLETVREYADGAVIWGGWSAENRPVVWDEQAPWWIATKNFLVNNTAKAPGRNLNPPALSIR